MGVLLQNDHPVGGISADVIEDINFDLTTNAKNLPGAINELNGKSSTTVSVTQAEYDALPSSKLTDDIAYYIKDGVPDVDNALWNKVGTATLETTSKDCSGAINELNSSIARKITYQDFTATTSSNGAVSLNTLLDGRKILCGIAISAYKQLILVYTDGWWAMFYNWPNFEKATNVSVTFRLFFYE